jgi:hypothetical protein
VDYKQNEVKLWMNVWNGVKHHEWVNLLYDVIPNSFLIKDSTSLFFIV